ncbi:MAG: hypothetical protein ACE5JQ_17495 [Candidatus Methylomirabilales bacterium]
MTLGEIKRLVAQGRYHYSRKVRDFIEEGFFDEEDLVHGVLSATRIHKKERDELRQAVHGMKYVILGRDTHGRSFYTVGKVIRGPKGRLYFYITAHQADKDFYRCWENNLELAAAEVGATGPAAPARNSKSKPQYL